jgi:hypothetical protein
MSASPLSISLRHLPLEALPAVAGRPVVVNVDIPSEGELDTGLMARIVGVYASLQLAGATAVLIEAPPSLAATLASLGLQSRVAGARDALAPTPSTSSPSIFAMLRPIFASVR